MYHFISYFISYFMTSVSKKPKKTKISKGFQNNNKKSK